MRQVCRTCGVELPEGSRRTRRFCDACQKRRQDERVRAYYDAHPDKQAQHLRKYKQRPEIKEARKHNMQQKLSNRASKAMKRRARGVKPKRVTIFGPYRVKNIGEGADTWEVVQMVDNRSNTWQELRPRKIYRSHQRQAAYGLCARLNRRWQGSLNPDEFDLLDYWKQATN